MGKAHENFQKISNFANPSKCLFPIHEAKSITNNS